MLSANIPYLLKKNINNNQRKFENSEWTIQRILVNLVCILVIENHSEIALLY